MTLKFNVYLPLPCIVQVVNAHPSLKLSGKNQQKKKLLTCNHFIFASTVNSGYSFVTSRIIGDRPYAPTHLFPKCALVLSTMSLSLTDHDNGDKIDVRYNDWMLDTTIGRWIQRFDDHIGAHWIHVCREPNVYAHRPP